MARFAAIVAAGLLASCPTDAAEAGAFTLEPGETKFFLFGMASAGDGHFDRKGKRRSRDDYRKRELQAYVEHGALDGLTLFGATAMQNIRSSHGVTVERGGLGRSEAGGRIRLWTDGAWIVSAQASGLLAGARRAEGLAAIGETDHQLDGRALAARSFEIFGRRAFLDVAAGYRFRSGDPADELRVDASLGVRILDRLLLIAQSFNHVGTARWKGPFPLKQRIHKVQGAALFDLSERLQLVGAAFFSPLGRDALDERGATVGIGLKF